MEKWAFFLSSRPESDEKRQDLKRMGTKGKQAR